MRESTLWTRSPACVILVILVIIASGLLAGCGDKQETPATDDIQSKARAMVEAIASGDYSSPVEDFDATMQREMPAATLQQAWETLLKRTGPFQSITGTRTEQAEGYQAVLVTCRFEDALIDIRWCTTGLQGRGVLLRARAGGHRIRTALLR